LEHIPDGFTQEITASPNQPENQPFAYVVSYRNQAGRYFVIEPEIGPDSQLKGEFNEQKYQTASGLVVHLSQPLQAPQSEQPITNALVISPDGSSLFVTSNLPRQQIKALLEEMVQGKG